MAQSVYFSIGTNLGDRFANLQRALGMLQEIMAVTAVSPVYATEPWGDTDQPEFLNICAAAVTDMSPVEVLDAIKSIEVEMGRLPSQHWGPRLIDIDLLLYGRNIIHTDKLTIPHPYMSERAFVLAPLADIVPGYAHPESGKTIQALLDEIDQSSVQRVGEVPFPPVSALSHAAA